MIYKVDFQKPTAAQRKVVRMRADGSLSACVSDLHVFPNFQGFEVSQSDISAISGPCVHPHKDGWIQTEKEPKIRRNCFWVLESTSCLYLHVGNAFTELLAGDYAVFDDSIVHSVISERKWWAVAYQLIPIAKPVTRKVNLS